MESFKILNDIQKEVVKLEEEIQLKKKELAALRQKEEPLPVKDYELLDWGGKSVKLSELFGGHNELLVISNMGKSCRYCTLWADGFIGLTSHLKNRAGFIMVSPDPIEVQKEFATSRGWNFPMFSDESSDFRIDLGFRDLKNVQPGVMVFTKDGKGQIYLFSRSFFGPGDNFCVMWDMMDLMPGGDNKWEPKYHY
jgi:predicted dithiol-disulfide oxidoreductase (DUF899 family)